MPGMSEPTFSSMGLVQVIYLFQLSMNNRLNY
jgi:hypothetical protein